MLKHLVDHFLARPKRLVAVPTWWVPESAVGFGLAALLLLAGVVALHTGRMNERVLRH